MSHKPYIPAPADTSAVTLPDELAELAEDMARNVHEVWAKSRIDEGWRYGPERNDRLKTHPCLVSYDELSEGERDYDRATSLETLRLIISLGFEIKRCKQS